MCATSGRPAASATSMDATDLTSSLPTWTVGSGQVQVPRSDPQHSATPVTGVTQAASDSLSPTTVKLHRYKSATQAVYWLVELWEGEANSVPPSPASTHAVPFEKQEF